MTAKDAKRLPMAAKNENRLVKETSPYLLQHAHNPVDWFPWGQEALERSKREDKPILLSIGYAACHWCHVMERESFENESIAEFMNEHFVCIKVDREERPDIDEIYMAATVALSGAGGWPMTVFLTPDQKPFFAGTYFPPTDHHGRPGFPTLLQKMAELWEGERDTLLEQARELTDHVRAQARVSRPTAVSDASIGAAVQSLSSSFDSEWGGFGPAPKFPASASLQLLLRHHQRSGDARSLEMVVTTLNGMKNGGIYDHVAGGFARYSTDDRWLVPHFEKMLYDNAQLARVYLAAFQVTEDPEYRRVAEETLDYVIREMQDESGGFYSATDADSQGVEGKFFVWDLAELAIILGPKEAEIFCAYYGVSEDGNWEGHNILTTPRPMPEVAAELGLETEALRSQLAKLREQVYAARQKRVPPLLDDKILTAWNGLMIGAMAEGYRVLGDARYLASAQCAADYVLAKLVREDGGLFRTARAGRAHLDAVLEDYAYLTEALIDLYEAGGDEKYLEGAERVGARAVKDFADEESGAFFFTARGHEPLITRTREGHDGALPNAGAVMASALLRLGRQLDREPLVERAKSFAATYGREIERIPRAFSTTLALVDSLLSPPVELVFAGDGAAPALQELRAEVAKAFLPNRVVGFAASKPDSTARALLRDKGAVGGKPALYICRDFTCQAPITSPAQIASALAAHTSSLKDARTASVGVSNLDGCATAEGTSRLARRHIKAHGENAYRCLGSLDLQVSRFGFGGYRVDDRAGEHRAALRHALQSGVNLIDTSTNYTDGHSERLVGEVLWDLAREGELARDEVVVVSKIGYVQGENLSLAESRESEGKPFAEMVKVGRGMWHCLHPEWLEDQLARSRDRLGLSCVDVCLLHNPEYYLSEAASRDMPLPEARDEFYRRLTQAFVWLEGAVKRGEILAYGVSSNTSVAATEDREATDLARMIAAAEAAAGASGLGPDEHHFCVLQLPFNLLEPAAALLANTSAVPMTVLDYAAQNSTAVLINRPLNALIPDGLFRLAEPEEFESGVPMDAAMAKLEALEKEFRTNIAPSIQTGKGAPPPQALLDWANQLTRLPSDKLTAAQWDEVESQIVTPRTTQVLSALDRGMRGPQADNWRELRGRYVEALDRVLQAFRAKAVAQTAENSRALTAKLDPTLPKERRAAPLSQKALHVLSSCPGVTSVLVGMRRKQWVDDVLPVLSLADLPEPAASLKALRDA